MNLAENLTKAAREHPDAVAIKLDDAELAYKHLDAAASGVANLLVKKREVGFYLSDPGAKLVFAWHDFAEAAEAGAEEAGAELILVKPGEFEQLVGEHSDEFEAVDRDDDDTAVILYTSGTTGKPKGAELTHANLAKNVEVAS